MATNKEQNMSQKQYTMADVEVVREFFSDMYKECYGFRPRGFSDESMIHWVNTTDVQSIIDEEEARTQAWLESMGFKTMSEYYDHLDRCRDAKFQGRHTPLTPADAQLKADQEITALEALDPILMGVPF